MPVTSKKASVYVSFQILMFRYINIIVEINLHSDYIHMHHVAKEGAEKWSTPNKLDKCVCKKRNQE